MNCNPPGSSVHRIFQARILEQIAISYSRGSSQVRDQSPAFCIGRWILYHQHHLSLFHLLHLAHQEILMCLYFKNISHLPWFLQEPIITLVQDPDISTQVSNAVLSLCLKSLFHGAIRVGLLKYKSDYDTFHRKLQKCFISLRKKT